MYIICRVAGYLDKFDFQINKDKSFRGRGPMEPDPLISQVTALTES